MKNENLALILGGYINGYSIIKELYECNVEHIWLFDNGYSISQHSNKISGYSVFENNSQSLLSEINKLRGLFNLVVIYPTDDIQLELLNEIYNDICDFCFIPFNHDNLKKSLDKSYQYKICDDIGIPYPKTINIFNKGDLTRVLDLKLPVLIKPNTREDLSTSVFRNLYLENLDDLNNHRKSIEKYIDNGIGFLASEYVPGDDTKIYAYTAYRSEAGILNEWIGKKLTQFPNYFGIFSSGSNECPVVVAEQGRKLLNNMSIIGIAEPEFKLDERDGQFKLMEINLRSMMWHRVGNLSGVKLQYTQWLDAIGEPIPKYIQQQDKIVHFVYMKHEILNLFRRKNYLKHFLHNVFSGDERNFAIFDKSDLKPFVFSFYYLMKFGVISCLKKLKGKF